MEVIGTVDRIREEARRIESQCLWAAESHYAAETPWYFVNYWLGIPSTVLAALAGVTAASQYKYSPLIAATIALLSAALTSLLTFLDPYKRASIHHSTGRNYELLYHTVGFFLRYGSIKENADFEELEKRLMTFMEKFNELLQAAPPLTGRAYRIAKENMRKGQGEVLQPHDPSETK